MLSNPIYLICLFSLSIHQIISVIALEELNSDVAASPRRRLSAAKRHYQLSTRDIKGCLHHNHHLHYVEDDNYGYNSPFHSKVGASFHIPTVLLEDIEHQIDRVECQSSQILLYFNSAETLEHARKEFESVKKFLLITSHQGCNEAGERDPHLVSDISIHADDRLITLSTSRVPWKSTFHTATLDFGPSNEVFAVRRHRGLRPRQVAPAAISTSVVFPAAPTATPSNFNVTEITNKQWLNTAILPPDTSLGTVSVTGPKLPSGFKISCKNCTIHGSIDVFSGSLTMGSNQSSNETDSVINFLKDGYVELRPNNFGAHIELENSVLASELLTNYTAPIPTIALTPFQIPGIASVGLELDPVLSVGVQLAATLDFTYGFDVSIPSGSSITLGVGTNANSSQHGFEEASIKAIPFQAPSANVALTVKAGFIPQLLLGVAFFDGDATASGGIFLDLPSLTSTFSAVSHVNHKCENITNNPTANNVITDVFDALTHIDAEVEIGLGVIAKANGKVGAYQVNDIASTVILTTQYALPTGCLSFDGHRKTYAPATPTSSGASGASGASGTGVNGGPGPKSSASGIGKPFGELGPAKVALGLIVIGVLFTSF